MKFSPNEGNLDRGIRVIVGLAMLAWGVYAQSWLGIIGVVLVITGLTGFCGLYKLLGINTCPLKK